MNSEIRKLLQDIKEQPAVYFGKKTFNGIIEHIEGYRHCMYVRDGVCPEGFYEFQKFVERYYDLNNNINTNRHWSDIIKFFNPSEECAFDEFYKLLDEFIEKGVPE
jgi:hypothetical protein